MKGISAWSIKNPVPTIVMFVVMIYFGVLGYQELRINNLPDIDFPRVSVSVTQQGASPTELETQVTNLIENAVTTIENVESVSSTISEGLSSTSIEFELGTDMIVAMSDVEQALSSIRQNLPSGADDPSVSRVNASDSAILSYVVSGDGMDPDQLSWATDNEIAKTLLGTEGVSKITRLGGVSKIIKVEVTPDKLAAYGLTISSINTALANQNINLPGGRVTTGGVERSIRTLGNTTSIDELRALAIPLQSGASIALEDLAMVTSTWETPRQNARFNGREVVAFQVFAAKSASQVHVAERVREAVEQFNKRKIGKLAVEEVSSASDFVVESYHAAFEALWIGAILAVIVVFVFLRDLRATLVAATALPLSLIPTFAVMQWMDMSLNSITLLALSLVVGILVDDAIVEIENIVRHMRQTGISAYQAAMEAADEIGLAVIATTATIIAVFLPVAFMPGIPGQFFFSFAVVTCVSVALSLLVARTITPMFAAFFLNSGVHEEKVAGWVKFYQRLLSGCLRFRFVTLLLGLAFFAGSAFLASKLNQEFMTATDRGRTTITVSLQPGTPLAETDAAIMQVWKIIKDEPEIESIFSSIGGGISAGGGPAARSNRADSASGTIIVNLKDRSERTLSQQEFETKVSGMLDNLPGVNLRIGDSSNSGATYSLTLTSTDSAMLASTANQIVEEMRGVKGLSNPSTTAAAVRPEILVIPDKRLITEYGKTISEIAQLINVTTLGPSDDDAAKFNLGDRQVPIVPMLPENVLTNTDAISTMPVSVNGKIMPLEAMAIISYGAGPTSINHSEGKRSVTIEADMQGLTLSEARSKVLGLPAYKAMPETITEMERGDSKRLKELFGSFYTAFATGILFMYLTLVILFRSFLQPITILTALPLSIGGALGFLYVTGSSLAMTALIGILLLMGIAAKNSILLVEYAIVAIKNGTERHQALMDAARKRARPIVMTSVAMGAGMAPIALGIGADAESRVPMGVAVIGGLISSTLLSLIFVPVVYTYIDDFERWIGRRLRNMANEAE